MCLEDFLWAFFDHMLSVPSSGEEMHNEVFGRRMQPILAMILFVCIVSNFRIVAGYKWSERTTRNYERLQEEAIYPPIKFTNEKRV